MCNISKLYSPALSRRRGRWLRRAQEKGLGNRCRSIQPEAGAAEPREWRHGHEQGPAADFDDSTGSFEMFIDAERISEFTLRRVT